MLTRLRRLLFWRWQGRWITYSNGLLLGMVLSGALLWTESPLALVVRDIADFTNGGLPYQTLAGAMVIAGSVGLFRCWKPHELFLLHIPYFLLAFMVWWMTLFFPMPYRTLARAWVWGWPVYLTFFQIIEKTTARLTKSDLS